MAYWLFKTEPEAFSIDDLERAGTEEWSGVRNFTARNNMLAMKVGDLGFFYHSSTKPTGVVGICEVATLAHPDSTQFDPASDYYDPSSRSEKPKWWCVDVRFVERLPRIVTLAEMRAMPELTGMTLLERSRLSVQPVEERYWRAVLARARS